MLTSTCCLSTLSVLVGFVFIVPTSSENPCCSYPCKNKGICITKGFHQFSCDCTGTDYYGDLCQHQTTAAYISDRLTITSDVLAFLSTRYELFWRIVNLIPLIYNKFMENVLTIKARVVEIPPNYDSEHTYVTHGITVNRTLYARMLPPVPMDCPTPMGVKGPKELPDVDLVIEKLFVRKQFRPEVRGTSLLFVFFAQHLSHQFFKTDFDKGEEITWGNHAMDCSHIYGRNRTVEAALRRFTDGKLKSQIIDGEEFPPYLKDVQGVPRRYPSNYSENNFALGHEFFLLPGVFVFSIIWLREHNRVCDIMKKEHPEWDDEQLFQTAKLIINGIQLKIVIEDYVQHISSSAFRFRFNPEVLFDKPFQYQNHMNVEFNHAYRWHSMFPEEYKLGPIMYPMEEYKLNLQLVVKHGMHDVVDSMSKQRAGLVSFYNHGPSGIPILKQTILCGRKLRFQSMNRYREKLELPAYKSFEELTGEKKISKILQSLYVDVDAVELHVGLLVEKKRGKSIFGITQSDIISAYSFRGIMSHPICTPHFWKPSTFGGDVGMNLVKTASLVKLFCNNIKGPCPQVSFRVPDFYEGDTSEDYKEEL